MCAEIRERTAAAALVPDSSRMMVAARPSDPCGSGLGQVRTAAPSMASCGSGSGWCVPVPRWTVPAIPSTVRGVPSGTVNRCLGSAVTQGMLSSRATIAACESGPPVVAAIAAGR